MQITKTRRTKSTAARVWKNVALVLGVIVAYLLTCMQLTSPLTLLFVKKAGKYSLNQAEQETRGEEEDRDLFRNKRVICQDLFASSSSPFNKKNDLPLQLHDPNRGQLFARQTIGSPSFWVSVHEKTFDPPRYDIMGNGDYYEDVLTRLFVDIISHEISVATSNSQPPVIHVVDVGGNIGWFSLVSLATAQSAFNNSTIHDDMHQPRFVLDVFEPNPLNRLRFCESLYLNGWLQHQITSKTTRKNNISINIYPMGVSNTAAHGTSATMDFSLAGRAKVEALNNNKNNNEDNAAVVTFPIVSLDEMNSAKGGGLGYPFLTPLSHTTIGGSSNNNKNNDNNPIAILKVDVEGLELEVFQGAFKSLLQTKRVKNLFMEGNLIPEKFHAIVTLFVKCGYYAHAVGDAKGPGKKITMKPQQVFHQHQALGFRPTNGIHKQSWLEEYKQKIFQECNDLGGGIQCNLWWRPA